jgi:hypothetical protein
MPRSNAGENHAANCDNQNYGLPVHTETPGNTKGQKECGGRRAVMFYSRFLWGKFCAAWRIFSTDVYGHRNTPCAKRPTQFAKPACNAGAALWATALRREIVMADYIPVAFYQGVMTRRAKRSATLRVVYIAGVNVMQASIQRDISGSR